MAISEDLEVPLLARSGAARANAGEVEPAQGSDSDNQDSNAENEGSLPGEVNVSPETQRQNDLERLERTLFGTGSWRRSLADAKPRRCRDVPVNIFTLRYAPAAMRSTASLAGDGKVFAFVCTAPSHVDVKAGECAHLSGHGQG